MYDTALSHEIDSDALLRVSISGLSIHKCNSFYTSLLSFLCWIRLCVYVRKLAYRKICQSRVFYVNNCNENRCSILPGICHTLANNATSPRKYLTKPGLFQLNRDTVEKCP